MRYIKMCNTFKGVILVKLIYKTGKKKNKNKTGIIMPRIHISYIRLPMESNQG